MEFSKPTQRRKPLGPIRKQKTKTHFNSNSQKRDYQKLTQKQKEQLIVKIFEKNSGVRETSKLVGMKLSTAKGLYSKFKKTGQIGCKQTKPFFIAYFQQKFNQDWHSFRNHFSFPKESIHFQQSQKDLTFYSGKFPPKEKISALLQVFLDNYPEDQFDLNNKLLNLIYGKMMNKKQEVEIKQNYLDSSDHSQTIDYTLNNNIQNKLSRHHQLLHQIQQQSVFQQPFNQEQKTLTQPLNQSLIVSSQDKNSYENLFSSNEPRIQNLNQCQMLQQKKSTLLPLLFASYQIPTQKQQTLNNQLGVYHDNNKDKYQQLLSNFLNQKLLNQSNLVSFSRDNFEKQGFLQQNFDDTTKYSQQNLSIQQLLQGFKEKF